MLIISLTLKDSVVTVILVTVQTVCTVHKKLSLTQQIVTDKGLAR